jgi:phospholipase/lecithinase/hemolysin
MVKAARGAGAVPILLTYGAARGAYGVVNEEIRQAAAATGASLIDVASAFDRRCTQGACHLLFWDEHPTDAGHQRVADTVLRELRTRNLIVCTAGSDGVTRVTVVFHQPQRRASSGRWGACQHKVAKSKCFGAAFTWSQDEW